MLVAVIVFVLIFLAALCLYYYNRLIGLNNRAEEAFSGIDVQLKKRYDLIPNLVSAVKAYMIHERKLLEDVTALRSRVVSGAMTKDELLGAEAASRDMLRNIMIAVENYPDLKSSENVKDLQRSLNEIESQLSAARRSYNAMARNLNDAVGMIPSSFFAYFMGIKRMEYIDVPESGTVNPNVAALFDMRPMIDDRSR